MRRQVTVVIAMLMLSIGARADGDLSKYSPEQKQQLASAIQLLLNTGVLQMDATGDVHLQPGLFDQLEKEGLISTENAKPQTICVGPLGN